jgi:hypothetical protein
LSQSGILHDPATLHPRQAHTRVALSQTRTPIAEAPPTLPVIDTRHPLVAIGILSTAGRAGSTSGQYQQRRAGHRASRQRDRASVVIRFILAGDVERRPDVLQEQSSHGDLIFTGDPEGRFNCSWKYIRWFSLALPLFPHARFLAAADDDTHIQFAHLEADLRGVHANPQSAVLWGLIMWKAFVNAHTLSTQDSVDGRHFFDDSAVQHRKRMDACLREGRGGAINHSAPACKSLPASERVALDRREIDASLPPFAMINAPLFAVSRFLASRLSNASQPQAYMQALSRSPRVIAALARRRSPRKAHVSCWPDTGTVIGFWVSLVSRAEGINVTLVHTPAWVQHFVYPAGRPFTNASIVVHGLKGGATEPIRQKAIRTGAGPFVPFRRVCGSCESMGWSTWPESHTRRWTCCGQHAPTLR